jgi:hypothetical protein
MLTDAGHAVEAVHSGQQLTPPRPVVLFMTGYGDSPAEAE